MEQALDAIRAEVVDLRARVDDAVQFPSTSPTGSDILDTSKTYLLSRTLLLLFLL
jgi:hypothetical protein